MWAKEYERCIRCGTTEIPHFGKGYCRICYFRVNERFFEAWSKEMAYVLGLLYADGCMHHNKFSLSLKERNFLEQIRSILENTHPIRKSKIQELHHLSIGSTKMIEDLLNLGFIPKAINSYKNWTINQLMSSSYRWLNRKAQPRAEKDKLIQEWLNQKTSQFSATR